MGKGHYIQNARCNFSKTFLKNCLSFQFMLSS